MKIGRKSTWLIFVAGAGMLGAVQPAGGQAPTRFKDPQVAQSYALYFTGLGHFYTGETLRAAALSGTTVVGTYLFIQELGCVGIEVDSCSAAKRWLSFGAALSAYVYGIIDAKPSAERVNARLREATGAQGYLDLGNSGRVYAGLQLKLMEERK